MIQTQTRARLVLQTWTEPVWWQKYHLWLDLIKVCSNISYCGAVSSQHVLVSHVFYCLEGTRLFLFVFFRKCTSYLRSAHTARLNCIYLSWLPWRLMTSTSLFPSLSIYPLLSPPDHPYPHAVSSLHLSIHPSLRAAGGINISCSSCPRGYTSPSYRNPTTALLQLWPPTSQPCSGQSAQPPLSDPAGFAANGRPWQGSS